MGQVRLKVQVKDYLHQEFDTATAHPIAETFEDLHISSLNINGWTENNKELRLALIKHTSPDVLCLQETHLDAGQSINIEGYLWIGHNRTNKHVKVKKASGGGWKYLLKTRY